MSLQDLKIYILNSLTLVLSSTDIDYALKIILILLSIGYTSQRWYVLFIEGKNKTNGKKEDK
jgi:hypothetical protein